MPMESHRHTSHIDYLAYLEKLVCKPVLTNFLQTLTYRETESLNSPAK